MPTDDEENVKILLLGLLLSEGCLSLPSAAVYTTDVIFSLVPSWDLWPIPVPVYSTDVWYI